MGFGKMLLIAYGFMTVTTPGALAILERRGGQSDVTCHDDFAWADNAQRLNPCLVAASVQGACTSTVFHVDKLMNGSFHYDVLKNPNKCSCSWAAYNLLSACEACQGFPLSIQPWASVSNSNECKPFLLDTYFPPGTVIEGDRTIPYWATINPQTWQNGAFNVDQAQSPANKHPDVDPSVAPTKKKSPVAAIAGGVVGGVAILALGAFAAWMIHRYKRQRSGTRELPGSLSHVRSFSDLSQKTGTTYYGVQQASRFAAPTIRTHATASVHSLPLGSPPAAASLFSLPQSPTRQAVSPPPQHVPLPPREEIIEPFTLVTPPTSPTGRPAFHRKGTSDGSDASSIPVSRAEDHTNTRRRINPPAYSGPANGQGHRPGHGVNPGSLGSQRSWESLESRSTHAVHGSLVGAAHHDRQNRNTEDDIPIA